MKKKINISGNIIILIVALAVFGGYLIYDKVFSDNTPPVVTCSSDEIVVSVKATDKELMQGVRAEDKRDGDVTDSLVIESISAFAGDERVIVYAAIDKKGNVGRAQRTLKYSDYEKAEFKLEKALRFPVGSSPNLLKYISAESSLDGDLTGNVKYSMNSGISSTTAGTYQVEYRVVDSTGTVSYLPVEIDMYNPVEERGTITLSEYLVYVDKGAYFDGGMYYQGANISGELSMSSNVNVNEEGVYAVDYRVSDGYSTAKSRLVVVVTE